MSRQGSGVFVRTRPGRGEVPAVELLELVDELEDSRRRYATLPGDAVVDELVARLNAVLGR